MKKYLGKILKGNVTFLSLGDSKDLGKKPRDSLVAEIGGFVGDRHAGPTRGTYSGEWGPKGTLRRNERQWSAVSNEELTIINERLDLCEPLSPDFVGANLCIEGIDELSLLPKGTKMLFPSGAVLLVEEYNPPCVDMGALIAEHFSTNSGVPLTAQSWLRPAAGRRGVVGVIDLPGEICIGDEVEVWVFEPPVIRLL
ncbi:MAG: hypothetical protein ACI9H8_001711 [Lysobacterales bacterium]|jgi:hypothetical protein